MPVTEMFAMSASEMRDRTPDNLAPVFPHLAPETLTATLDGGYLRSIYLHHLAYPYVPDSTPAASLSEQNAWASLARSLNFTLGQAVRQARLRGQREGKGGVCLTCGCAVGEEHEYPCPEELCPICGRLLCAPSADSAGGCGCKHRYFGSSDVEEHFRSGNPSGEDEEWLKELRRRGRVMYAGALSTAQETDTTSER